MDLAPHDQKLVADLVLDIEEFVQYRNGLLVRGEIRSRRPDSIGAPAERRLDLADQQLPMLRTLLAEFGEEYWKAQSTIDVMSIDRSAKDSLEIVYSEYTELHYLRSRERPERPEYTAYRADYLAVFTKDKSDWHLASVEIVVPELADGEKGLGNEIMLPITEPVEGRQIASSKAELLEDLRLADEEVRSEGALRNREDVPDPDAPPDRAEQQAMMLEELESETAAGWYAGEGEYAAAPLEFAAVHYKTTDIPFASFYAWVHWSNYNGDYKTHTNDCTNFISQVMKASGWPDDTGLWWKNSVWWYNHVPVNLDMNKDGTKNHSMCVHQRSYSSQGLEIYLTYHTTDTFKRTLTSMLAAAGGQWWWYTHRTH